MEYVKPPTSSKIVVGRVYGQLTILGYVGSSKWSVHCSCGNDVIRSSSEINSNRSPAIPRCPECSKRAQKEVMLKAQASRGYRFTDRVGQIVEGKDRWKVVKYISPKWEVKCLSCGDVRYVSSTAIVNRKVRCYSCRPTLVNNTTIRDKVISLLSDGYKTKEIANHLGISRYSVASIKAQAIEDNRLGAFDNNADLTFAEIAELLGISTTSVYALYQSGIAKLYKALKEVDLSLPQAEELMYQEDNLSLHRSKIV
jgi:DNA-binding CsgD family transcriptional regulator